MPRIADCGWLMMIGDANSEPEVPWLEIVKVPPCTSPALSLPLRAAAVSACIEAFHATGDTLEEASAALLAECRADGGQDCTVDEYSNDNLCIVSVADDDSDVVAGGAGVNVEAARIDALARAAGNNTPIAADAPVVISDCP